MEFDCQPVTNFRKLRWTQRDHQKSEHCIFPRFPLYYWLIPNLRGCQKVSQVHFHPRWVRNFHILSGRKSRTSGKIFASINFLFTRFERASMLIANDKIAVTMIIEFTCIFISTFMIAAIRAVFKFKSLQQTAAFIKFAKFN